MNIELPNTLSELRELKKSYSDSLAYGKIQLKEDISLESKQRLKRRLVLIERFIRLINSKMKLVQAELNVKRGKNVR
jgi:hypothetical protein